MVNVFGRQHLIFMIKLLQSHEDYVDLLYKEMTLEQSLYYPFDSREEYSRYGNSFIHFH